jgi:pimeloyl-ACP methyl ester carboxylesterase
MRQAGRVESPVLIVAAEADSIVPIKAVEKTASRIKNVTLHRLSCNHFAPNMGKFFEKNIKIETEFLERHLFD